MRKILQFSMATAALLIGAGSATAAALSVTPAPVKVVGTPDNFVELYAPAMTDMSKPIAKAPGQTSILGITLNTDGTDAWPIKVCVATEVDGEIFWENAEQISDSYFEISLPDGNYEVLSFYYTDNNNAGALLSQNVSVEGENVQIEMKVTDATIKTFVTPKDTEGNTLNYSGSPSDINVIEYGVFTFLDYKGTLVCYDFFDQPIAYYCSNTKDSDYHIYAISRALCKGDLGVFYAILPIDFNQAEASPTTTNWQTVDVDFQPTPFNIKYQTEDNYFYGFSTCMASYIAEGLWFFSAGQAARFCNTGKIGVWAPENYNGFVDVVVNPIGCAFGGNDSSISGLPLKRTENGLTQIGQNMYFGRSLFTNPYNTDLRIGGNPYYQFNPDGMKFGNCAPTLINFQYSWAGFEYQFTGRMGEELSIDSFNLAKSTSLLDDYDNKCTSSVFITCDGNTICNSRFEFDPDGDWPDGNYHAEISTDNVLVDGEVAGYNKTVFEYDTDNMGQSPTIAGLQFRDTDDHITDHFSTAADGRMILYATQFMADYDEETDDMWYRSISVKNITVEAAPYNTEDYFEIPVVTDPAKDYELGWGQYFEANLGCVTARSENGWFKLRIKMEGINDGWQEQIICPAFKIESLNNGVKGVKAEASPLNFQIDGRNIVAPGARIFDMNGVETNGKNLMPGVYLISAGNKTAKALVK